MEEDVEQLKQRLQQVHQSSAEIERELELEIEARNEECQCLKEQLEQALEKIADYERSSGPSKEMIRTLETRIEELEKNERIKEGSLAMLEQENRTVLEELALVSLKLEEKNEAQVELQRALQNLRDAQDEITRLVKLTTNSALKVPSENVEKQTNSSRTSASRIFKTAELRSNEWKQNEASFRNLKSKKPLPTPQFGRGHGEKIQ